MSVSRYHGFQSKLDGVWTTVILLSSYLFGSVPWFDDSTQLFIYFEQTYDLSACKFRLAACACTGTLNLQKPVFVSKNNVFRFICFGFDGGGTVLLTFFMIPCMLLACLLTLNCFQSSAVLNLRLLGMKVMFQVFNHPQWPTCRK